MLSVNEKLSLLLFRPKEFYTKVKGEEGYAKPLFLYAILLILVSIFGIVLESIAGFKAGAEIYQNVFLILVSHVFVISVLVGAAFLGPFISSGLTHLGLIILGVKGNFQKTFKVVTYAGIIGIFYSIIIYVMDFFFYLAYPELLDSPELFFQSDLIWTLALSGVIGLISFIHVIILEVIGLVTEYKISGLRAFFAVLIGVLLPILVLVVLAIVIILFVLLLVLIGSSAGASGMMASFI